MLLWEIAVAKVLLPVAKSLARISYRLIRKKVRKEFAVLEISEALEKGKLSFDERFTVLGTFSEYIPFVDFTTFIKTDIRSEITGTCRLGDIVKSGTYLGALFPLETKKATEPAIPLVYSSAGKSTKIFSFTTGDQLKLECRLVPLDYEFRDILYKKEQFCFQDRPFGLEILDVYTEKPEKVDKFVIDAFFLSSLEYEEGIDNLFSSLNEIAEVWQNETETLIPLTVGIILVGLHRNGAIASVISRKPELDELKSIRALISHDWIEKKLYRLSRRVDILDSKGSQALINDMKNVITHYSFVEKYDLEDWAGIETLLEGKFNSRQKKFLSKNKDLARFARKLHNRADLLKAWKFYLEPTLNIDFQFDQICPIIKQTIDPRAILKQRGF